MQLAGTINYAIYENGSEYYGTASLTDADRKNKIFNVNGAGIAGDVTIPVVGHRDAMTMKINFRTATEDAYHLAEMRRHILDCRIAAEEYEPTSGQFRVHPNKIIVEVIPLSLSGGDIAPSSPQAISGEYTVISRKCYLDDVLMEDYQPLNVIDVDASGRDNLAEVRAALGK